jgi:hypothetical protein
VSDLTTTTLHTVVRWVASDYDGETYQGSYDVVTKDVGATIGVGVYSGEKLIHSFYAHTRYGFTAAEIARDLIANTVERIRDDMGAKSVAVQFWRVFPTLVRQAGHNELDPVLLTDACICPTDPAEYGFCPRWQGEDPVCRN